MEGYLKTRSWDSPEGTKIFRTEIVLENLVLLGRKDDEGSSDVARAEKLFVDDATQEGELPADGGS